jgi:DNA mismatch repair ATPase MutS
LKRWDGISNELELTPNELNELSPMLQVYWTIKSKNMNVIVFLEFGKMEFLAFENDAIKLN